MKKSTQSKRSKPRRTPSPRKTVARKTTKKAPARNPNLEAFGRRFRLIREAAGVSLRQLQQATELPKARIARLETTRQDLNPEHFEDWQHILSLVSSLRDMSDTLDDPRDVYRLVSLLGRPVTIEDMRDLCRDVDPEILEQRAWLTWPSTMPLLKQPVVMRQAEWAWLWDRVIPTDDIGRQAIDAGIRIDAAITGAPGVGKSTLVQMFGVSQTVAAHFPDGVLYANQQTADARVWLARWAEQYGVELPEDGQTVLWRDALRIRLRRLAVLVILDDVRNLAFVESLLVTDGEHSRIVIVSRRQDLIEQLGLASDHVLAMQPMTPESGLELLQAYVPRVSWTDHDTAAARQVIDRLGGAPHGLRIVGQSLSQAEPGQRAQRWQGILRRLVRDRLTAIEGLREVYDAAYAELGDLQPTYRVLGVGTWGAPISDGWVAAMRGKSERAARREMLGLVSSGLISQHLDNDMRVWYQAHVLVSEHAAQQLDKAERETYAERHAVYLARLLLSDPNSSEWLYIPAGLPHVDQLRRAATWCVDHLDTPEHILLAQALYLAACGRIALDGRLNDILPLGQALCNLHMPGRVSGCVLWTHGRAMLDAGEPAKAASLLERGAQVLFECEDWPPAVCCLTDSSTAYHEAGQVEMAKRTAKLGNEWATVQETAIDAMLTVKDLNRARQDRRWLGQVNAVIELPDRPSPLSAVSVRRMCALNAKRLAEEVTGRPMTVRRRPVGRLPWQPEDLVYAVLMRQVAPLLLAGLESTPKRAESETGQA